MLLKRDGYLHFDLYGSYFCRRRVLVTHENSNIEITGELLQCLRPGAWLNDEVTTVNMSDVGGFYIMFCND